ncbi:hypothetical protein A7A08_00489 [Methyloligella halotolerans]|uniref:Uncharacterized protein n=1 Tax=Methyloligella halotolerans TaxID=1177755 RepID=A0A1E2S2E9_9HYPH|nr:hypothetical protein A7A08_00489 [Methyloligella halotolerans]
MVSIRVDNLSLAYRILRGPGSGAIAESIIQAAI